MKEYPILFSTDMVRTTLDGRKTKTRRTRNLNRVNKYPDEWIYRFWAGSPFKNHRSDNASGVDLPRHDFIHKSDGRVFSIECPYGQPGDVLWVRETWYQMNDPFDGTHLAYWYKADNDGMRPSKWRPSIHMPRAAARLFLQITDVRVERLQDISEEDAIAEGIDKYTLYNPDFPKEKDDEPVDIFHSLWESINGPGSWEANPWVWVISFKKIDAVNDKNVDKGRP